MNRSIAYLIMSLVLMLTGCDRMIKPLHISCQADNDLVKILRNQKGVNVILYSSALEAAQKAGEGEAVVILADNYPYSPEELEDSFFQLIEEKQLRAYLEFPSYLPGISVEGIRKANVERAIVSSGFFRGFPDSLAILGINGLHCLRTDAVNGPLHIVAGRVAGFDSAIFGLPREMYPLLFEMQGLPVLVATTSFSRFVSGRYGPRGEWEAVWEKMLEYLLPGTSLQELDWKPSVEPTYSRNESLPADAQLLSYSRGIEWYKNARMLIPSSYKDTLRHLVESGIQRLSWNESMPVGDGSDGVFECIFSEIDENGNQSIGIMQRGDCTSETAMAFATVGKSLNNKEYLNTAQNLLDYYLLNSPATRNEYGDPGHAAYGLIPWGISNYAWYKASYGDDNARFILAALTTAAFTETDHWDEILMRSLLALVRTTGENGFRGSRIDLSDFEKNDWQYYFNREITNLSPHFECYLWACYLWAYDKTGDEIFLKRAQNGIHAMMENYPDGWHWTNGLAQERARMILPLAWLVRVNDTPEHREMLFTVVNDFLKLQERCGAIREELGDIALGKYPPPQSNEDYGVTEASLIARNGDPVSDLLYTTNFAFLGLHEAFYATNDPAIKKANDKLAEFLCRIQVKSESHPEVNGGWMRAFDYQRFDYWGSNADHGWGAWAIETGWTQGWITTIMALRDLDKSIWDVTENSRINNQYKLLKEEMLPEADLQ